MNDTMTATTITQQLHTGTKMPAIGLGTWQIRGSVRQAVEAAIAAGYRMIDTSGDYGSQPGIGEALISNGIPREDVFIVSKIEEYDDAYEATMKNLAELQLDYVDLMLIHRPAETDEMNEALWRGLITACHEGKIRDIGVSNFSEAQIQSLIDRTGVKPVVNQIEWSPFGWDSAMDTYCAEKGIIIQSYSPLTRAERLHDSMIMGIADIYHKTPSQILLRWNVQHGWVPLPKSDNPAHIRENIDIFDFKLDKKDMVAIDAMNESFSALAEQPIYQLNRKEETHMRYRQLIKAVQQYSGFSDAESKDALEGAVATIAIHLTEGERKDFASQLPRELQDLALAVYPSEENSNQDLFEQFIEVQAVDESRAKKQLLSAWRALKDALSPGQIDHIRGQLSDRTAKFLH